MADLISAPQHFTTVNYVTKDGENVSATKNNGVVTLVGDKKGTRQMSIDEFKQELIQNSARVDLEKTPAKDTVEISSTVNKSDEPKAEVKAEEVKPAEAKPVEAKAEEVKTDKVEDKKEEAPASDAKETEPKAEQGKKLDVNA